MRARGDDCPFDEPTATTYVSEEWKWAADCRAGSRSQVLSRQSTLGPCRYVKDIAVSPRDIKGCYTVQWALVIARRKPLNAHKIEE